RAVGRIAGRLAWRNAEALWDGRRCELEREPPDRIDEVANDH
ncbi:MAG: hypothetical protein JWP08_2225, partial [Bryobacterales bacterium]|nr:hypothetical protein [Bryobacterales bacterium]